MMPWEPGYYEGYALPKRIDGYVLEPMKMGRKLKARHEAWAAELMKDEEFIALLERLAELAKGST